jgi:hypothetical protein
MPNPFNYSAPDLTLHPPRSPRVRLGGYAILPRILDKCRAELAAKNGEYHYACPLDMNFFEFTGMDPAKLKAEVAFGKSDGEILEWLLKNQPRRREPWEIAQWSAFREAAAPADNESREFVSGQVAAAKAAHREDIATWFDYLDVDDFATFGGRP